MFKLRLVYFSWFILLLNMGCTEHVSQPTAPAAPTVEVSQPISANITEWDEYTGRFQAVNEVEVRARVSGYLQSVEFKDGQMVKEGDVLFVIDQRPFKIALQSAESRFSLARKELERGRDLRRKSSISQEEVDRRLNEFELAQAQLDSAKLDMEFTQVRAPISGLVSRDLVNKGNLVNGTSTNATVLTTIVSVDPIHFYFEAGERDLLKYIRLSQSSQRESSRTAANPVKIRLQDEKDFVHEGVMDFVDNRVDESTGTIQGRAILDNPGGDILPGIFGRIRLLARQNHPAILLPDAVVGTDQSRKFVYVVTDDGKVDRKFVELGKLHTRELRVITSGLEATDKVIVSGLMKVRPGMPATAKDTDISSQFTY